MHLLQTMNKRFYNHTAEVSVRPAKKLCTQTRLEEAGTHEIEEIFARSQIRGEIYTKFIQKRCAYIDACLEIIIQEGARRKYYFANYH